MDFSQEFPQTEALCPGSLDSARGFVLDMLQRMQPLRDKDLQRLGMRKRRSLEEASDGGKRKAEVLGNGDHGHGLNAWDAGEISRLWSIWLG